MEEETEAKNELTRKLQGKTFEFEEYKERYSKESHDRATVLEQEKRTLESEKFELESRLEIATARMQNVTQTKQRLERDLADLQLALDKEHQVARTAEKQAKIFEIKSKHFN